MQRDFIDIVGLMKLFTFPTKSELEKHARALTIHISDFVQLVQMCELASEPFEHHRFHRDRVPGHLTLSDVERNTLFTSEVGVPLTGKAVTAVNKISQLFKERRHISGHMFITPDHTKWYCFYFDQRDVDRDDQHWQHGPHIHFVNYLWPKLTAQGVWDEIQSDKPKLRDSLHIRWSHPIPAEYVPRVLDNGES
jgi:hypothetical protein